MEEQKPQTPAEFLASLENGPKPNQIAQWKAESPNGRVRVFSPDGKRAFILRSLNGMEFADLQAKVQKTSRPEQQEGEMNVALSVKACLWTNTTPTSKMTEVELKAASAGLPASLAAVVLELSDFFDPQTLAMTSGDL